MKSFADKIVALAATIGREREIAIRKLCDDVDRRIKKLEEANKNIAYHLNEVMQLVRMNTGEESSTRKGDVTTAREGTVTTTTVHEREDRIARLDAEVAQLDRNLQAEVVARVKAHCTCAPAQPSVEEMAERLWRAGEVHYGHEPRAWSECSKVGADYFRALARAALAPTKETPAASGGRDRAE